MTVARRPRARGATAALALLLALLATPARGGIRPQEPLPAVPAVGSEEEDRDQAAGSREPDDGLRVRGHAIALRDALHPGPPGVIGLDQEEVACRDDLPIARSELGPVAVDRDGLRERQLAIHGGGRRLAPSAAPAAVVPALVSEATHVAAAYANEGGGLVGIASAAVVALLLLAADWKRRVAPGRAAGATLPRPDGRKGRR